MRRFLLIILFAAALVAPAFAVPASTQAADGRYTCTIDTATETDDPNPNCDALSTDPAKNPCVANVGDCGTVGYLNDAINFFAAFVGVAVVLSIIIGGIQYSSSSGDPQKATAAKGRIRNAIVALVAFIFLYAFLNFVIIGGIG